MKTASIFQSAQWVNCLIQWVFREVDYTQQRREVVDDTW